ncbi:MAG: sensor histidine kinase [Cyclobacteriaceae bacterium]|nr:MAG: sensor histidine kinase [Cyclobacteriaceae bacterium]
MYVIFTVAIYYVQEPNLGLHVVYELASLPAKLFSVYFTLYFIVPSLLLKRKYWQATLLFSLTLIIGVLLLQIFVLNTVYPLYFPDVENNLLPNDLSKFVSPLLDLIIVTTIAVVIVLLKDREKQEFVRLNREKANVQNELKLLKSQLHPHFLFNTLNGLYAQILNNSDLAAEMVIKLSDLLRYIVYDARSALVNVDDDLECIINYVALERIRYNSKLQLSFSISGPTENKKIPPLLLLPFIENSFKHGIANNYEEGWIKCEIKLTDNELTMELQNSITPYIEEDEKMKEQVANGIGILNVRRRLKYNYDEQFCLKTRRSKECYEVNLKIPIIIP